MCGLVGIMKMGSNFGLMPVEEKMFQTMLRLDVLRGEHSTGIAAHDRDTGKMNVYKHMGPPQRSKTFKDNNVFNNNGHLKGIVDVLVGHNRYATQGAVNVDNAHPFIADNLVGAHNGTIDKNVLKRLGENKFETDSEFVYNKIKEIGLADTIKELDGGAWCLTWYDVKSKKMNFLRNSKRPLWFGQDKTFKRLAWASEKWMLEVAGERHGCTWDDVYELAEDTHLEIHSPTGEYTTKEVAAEKKPLFTKTTTGGKTSFQYSKGRAKAVQPVHKDAIRELRANIRKEVEVSPIEIRKQNGNEYLECIIDNWVDPEELAPLPFVNLRVFLNNKNRDKLTQWAKDPYHRDGTQDVFSFAIKDLKKDKLGYYYYLADLRSMEGPYYYSYINGKQQEDEEDEMVLVVGHNGKLLDREDFDKLAHKGCNNCLTIPHWDDAEELVWMNSQEFICGSCKNGDVVAPYLH